MATLLYRWIFTLIGKKGEKKLPTATAKKCFWLCRHPVLLQLPESELLLCRDSLMCLDGQMWASTRTQRVPGGYRPGQPALLRLSEEWHHLKTISVLEFITMRRQLHRSHLFLPLWHRENRSECLRASLAPPIHHECFLQRMDLFHALLPRLLFSSVLYHCAVQLSPSLPFAITPSLHRPSCITWDNGRRLVWCERK